MGAMKQEMVCYCEPEIKTQLDEMLTSQRLALGMQLEEMPTVLHWAMMMGVNPCHQVYVDQSECYPDHLKDQDGDIECVLLDQRW